jgi:hypothetical protein
MAYGDFVIKVGEEVAFARRHRNWGSLLNHGFGVVTKINGHGHIFVQSGDRELRFTRTGDAYKDSYGPTLLHADQLRRELAVADRRKEQRRIAQEIEQAIKSGYSYSGTFHVSEERVATLKELVNQLEMLVDKA